MSNEWYWNTAPTTYEKLVQAYFESIGKDDLNAEMHNAMALLDIKKHYLDQFMDEYPEELL